MMAEENRIEKFVVGNLNCMCCCGSAFSKVAYVLSPYDSLEKWIVEAASRYGVSVVVITGMEWDDDLTPWPAPGVPAGSPDFKGLAGHFLETLTGTVIPQIESRYGAASDVERSLIGISLSGLFALWQWPHSSFFRNIATLSGSFWYEGFAQWLCRQSFKGKEGRCFMLLGEREPHVRDKMFRRVGECTQMVVDHLRDGGVDITFELVPGNHYQYGIERLNLALSHLYHR